MRKIRAVDLFCGVGGLTHGLERSGVDVRLGIDKDASCSYAFEANNHAEFLEADVRDVTAAQIQEVLDGSEVSLLAGCAPCQPFSTYSRGVKRTQPANKRGKGHPEDWTLVRRFGELILEVKPDLVTMENVPPLADQDVFHEFVTALKVHYEVDFGVVECEAIGLPQRRKRLVLVASRLGPISLPEFDLPRRSVYETIGGLPPIPAGGSDPSDGMH